MDSHAVPDESIVVEGNCSALIQRKLPHKFKDPGSVTIPCSIGDVFVGKTLIDLGESINLMPLSMCQRIRNLKIAPTRMTLQLVDHSITRPFRVVEEVLIKVHQLTFPMDFVIMDIEEDVEIIHSGLVIRVGCKVCCGHGEWQLRDECGRLESNLQLI